MNMHENIDQALAKKLTKEQLLRVKSVELAIKATEGKPLTSEAVKSQYEEIFKFLTTK